MAPTKTGTPLRPKRRAYVERQAEFLKDLEKTDREGLALALKALDPDVLSDEDFDDDEFHLAEEFIHRSSV